MNRPRNRSEQALRGAHMDIDEVIGPQGAALVHELRKLQDALDRHGDVERNRYPAAGGPAPGAWHADSRTSTQMPPTRSAVGAWLGLFGLDWFTPIARTRAQRPREDGIAGTRRPIGRNAREALRHPAAERRISPVAAKILTADTGRSFLQLRAREPRSDDLSEHGQAPGKSSPQVPSRDRLRAIIQSGREFLKVGCGHLKGACTFLLARTRSAGAKGTSGEELAVSLQRAYSNELRIGLRILVLGFGVFGGWATLVPLASAVVVPGTLMVKSNVKTIQHPTGGVVAQILVHDGMHVRAGDVVLRLDETQRRAEYQVLIHQLNQARVRSARLVAERDGLSEPEIPHAIAVNLGDPDVRQLWTSELLLFKSRAGARRSAKELLRGRVEQLQEEVAGFEDQVKSKAAQRDLIALELKGVETLYQKRLVPLTRKTSLEREVARLDGDHGQTLAAIAETRSKISEAKLQIVRIDQDFGTEVMKSLRETQDKEAELVEKISAVRDLLKRLDLRAPNSGIVQQLSVHTIGGVVAPGAVVMEIVPDLGGLLIEAKLPPRDIDHVHVGQPTYVRFSAFNQRTTPQFKGVVSYVSPDLSHDRRTDAGYYTIRVTLPDDQRRRLGNLELVSGMPAEVFIETGTRTMISYLFKPISDQLSRTFNER